MRRHGLALVWRMVAGLAGASLVGVGLAAAQKPAAAPATNPVPATASSAQKPAQTPAQNPAQSQAPVATNANASSSNPGSQNPNGQNASGAAQRLWTLVLDASAWQPPATEAEYTRTRSAVVLGDRVAAVYRVAATVNEGGRPRERWKIVTVDLKTGQKKDEKEIVSTGRPYLFATDDEHLVVGRSGLERWNPDLTAAGEKLEAVSGERTAWETADAGTLASYDGRRTRMIDARTLKPTGYEIEGPQPTSISRQWMVTDRAPQGGVYTDESFAMLYDGVRPQAIERGKCVHRPQVLDKNRVLYTGCGRAVVVDLTGKPARTLKQAGRFVEWAGESRDGGRFVLMVSDYPLGDSAQGARETFVVYDAQTLEPVVSVDPGSLPESRSWAGLSADGHLLLAGGVRGLSLYKLP